jgi:hypothetical protein
MARDVEEFFMLFVDCLHILLREVSVHMPIY